MLLPQALFEQICGVCILDFGSVGGERREHPRVEFGYRATVIPCLRDQRGPAYVAVIRDMGVKGVGLLQSEEARVGEDFVLDVTKFVGRPLGIRCTVERTEPGGSGGTQFVVGATFNSILESAEELVPGPQLCDEFQVKGAGRWRALRQCVLRLLMIAS